MNAENKKIPPDFSGGMTKNHGVIFSNPGGGTAREYRISLCLVLCLREQISNQLIRQRHQKLFFPGCL